MTGPTGHPYADLSPAIDGRRRPHPPDRRSSPPRDRRAGGARRGQVGRRAVSRNGQCLSHPAARRRELL